MKAVCGQEAGPATAVPSFGALAQVQDKVSAFGALRRLGLPQPPAYVADSVGAAARCDQESVFVSGGLLVRQPAAGPLVMAQAMFDGGSLTAFHACEQVRHGVGGGSSHKRALPVPQARRCLESLGGALG